MNEKTFSAEILELNNMIRFVESVIDHCPKNIELALEEALVNICSHAYLEKKGTLTIQIQNDPGRLEVKISDQGIPYNPIQYLQNKKTENEIVGGLGVHLLSKLAHHLQYERCDNKNILSIYFFTS